MTSKIKLFGGEKESFQEWSRLLKTDLMGKGLYEVATNADPRPDDVQPAFWHADAAQAASFSLLQLRTRQEQRKWNSDNGKAIATITNHLDPDIAKRYDDNPLEEGNLAHHMLADLNARYGGVYDTKIIALFLLETQKPIPPSVRFEVWSARWENLQLKMGKRVAENSVDFLAQMKLVVEKSGSKDNNRSLKPLDFAESSNWDYVATRNHLIRSDKLVNESHSFNTSSISFGESTINQVQQGDEKEYFEWKRGNIRSNSPHPSRNQYNQDYSNNGGGRNSDNKSNFNSRNDRDRSRDRRDRSRDKYETYSYEYMYIFKFIYVYCTYILAFDDHYG